MLTESTRQRDFPTLAEQAYLNTAAEGIPPTVVIEALHRYGQDKLLGMDAVTTTNNNGRPRCEKWPTPTAFRRKT